MFFHQLKQVLPRDSYYSKEWYDLEQEFIFAGQWHLAGTTADLVNKGDYLAKTINGNPILLVNTGNEIKCHFNICRHRGAKILEDGFGRIRKSIKCLYHGWRYDMEGNNTSIPHESTCFGGIAPDERDLMEIGSAILGSLIFVNFDGLSSNHFTDFLTGYQK